MRYQLRSHCRAGVGDALLGNRPPAATASPPPPIEDVHSPEARGAPGYLAGPLVPDRQASTPASRTPLRLQTAGIHSRRRQLRSRALGVSVALSAVRAFSTVLSLWADLPLPEE